MARPILPPKHGQMEFKKQVQNRLDTSPTTQFVTPIIFNGSPYGGDGPPGTDWYVPVIASVFDSTQPCQPWAIVMDRIFKLGITATIPWRTDSGTTGEMRLTIPVIAESSAISLPANSSGNVSFAWLHGVDPYQFYDLFMFVEARRTGGAGEVHVGQPYHVSQVGPEGCTVAGV